MDRAGIETEIAPIVGAEQQAEDLIRLYQRKPGRGKYLGDQYFRKIHPAVGGRRNPEQAGHDQRRKSGEASGYYEEDRK